MTAIEAEPGSAPSVSPVIRAAPLVGGVVGVAGIVALAFGGDVGGVWHYTEAGLALLGFAAVGGGLAMALSAERNGMSTSLEGLERERSELVAKAKLLEAAKRESDSILGAVRAHLMLIDQSYFIQSRYSSELEAVFHQRELQNENFLNVLQRILSERMFKTARDYLALLFDPMRKERVVLKVNPLDEVEITADDADGGAGVRYLSFGFRRIMEGNVVSRVLVSVEDVTERTLRERQLRESEQQKVKQFELLLGILHVEPRQLDEFVDLANEQLGSIDEALKATDFASATIGQTALLRQRLDIVLQRVHNIKGNASLLKLEHFEKETQDFEQKIVDLKHRSALGGDDFLTVVIGLTALRSDLDDLQALRVKLAGIHRGVEIRAEVGDELVTNVRELAQTLGARFGKSVKIDSDGFDTRSLTGDQRMVVRDVLIQLTRNSIAHGIETSAEREAAGKPPVATIEIHPMADAPENAFAFTFRDDGRGLDAAKIRARAIEVGLLAPDAADSVDDSRIASYIFAPGFSTSEETTTASGRGVGLNVVKQRVVDDCGGEIGLDSEPGSYCEFSFVVPLSAAGREHARAAR